MRRFSFWRHPLLPLLILGLGLRLHTLDTGFWGDELHMFTHQGRVPLGTIPRFAVSGDNHVLLHLAARACMDWISPAEWAARLPVFVAGMLWIPSIWVFARRAFDNRPAAFLAAAFGATAPIHVMYSQFCRGYAPQILFAHWMVWILWRWMEEDALLRPSRGRIAALALLSAAAIYTVPTFALFSACLGLFLLWQWARGRLGGSHPPPPGALRLFVWLAGASVAAMLLYRVAFPGLWHNVVENQNLRIPFSRRLSENFLGLADLATQGTAPWILWLCLPGLAMIRAKNRNLYRLFLALFTLPPAMLSIAGVSGWPRSLLFWLPMIVLTWTAGILAVAERISALTLTLWKSRLDPEKTRRGLIAFAAALLVACHGRYLFTRYYPAWRANDLRQVRDEIVGRLGEHDLLILNIQDSYGKLGYYLGGEAERRMMNIIRDHRLDRIWYATLADTERNHDERILWPNRLAPEGIPAGRDLWIGRFFKYQPLNSHVRVPARAVRRAADFRGAVLYELRPRSVQRCRYPQAADRELPRQPANLGLATLEPSSTRVMEGTASLHILSLSPEAWHPLDPPFAAACAGPGWCLTFAAVSRRDRVELCLVETVGDLTTQLDRWRVNNCTGPVNHCYPDAQTYAILRPAWYPSCWLSQLAPGDRSLSEAVSCRSEGTIDGIQTYILLF